MLQVVESSETSLSFSWAPSSASVPPLTTGYRLECVTLHKSRDPSPELLTLTELSVTSAEMTGFLLGAMYNCCMSVTSLFSDSRPRCITHYIMSSTYILLNKFLPTLNFWFLSDRTLVVLQSSIAKVQASSTISLSSTTTTSTTVFYGNKTIGPITDHSSDSTHYDITTIAAVGGSLGAATAVCIVSITVYSNFTLLEADSPSKRQRVSAYFQDV